MITRINILVYKTVSPHIILYHLIIYVTTSGTPCSFFNGKIFYFKVSILVSSRFCLEMIQIMVELSIQFQFIISSIFSAQEGFEKKKQVFGAPISPTY